MKNRSFIILFTCITLFLFIGGVAAERGSIESQVSAHKKWSTEKIFKIPESVLYDNDKDIIYVANINGEPNAKDGNGFISKLMTNGEIETLEWITGLNAPKGMGVFEGKLYVTDIDHVVEIDIEKSKIVNQYTSAQAQFLNDITVHSSGTLYVSDNIANLIFRLKDGLLETWLKSAELDMPNGLFAEEDRLLVGINGSVLSMDLENKKVSRFIENTDFIDGLVSDGKGNYFISDFLGAIHVIHPQKKMIKIIDTTAENVMAADIDFVIDKKLLLVPTFMDNRVVAYEIRE